MPAGRALGQDHFKPCGPYRGSARSRIRQAALCPGRRRALEGQGSGEGRDALANLGEATRGQAVAGSDDAYRAHWPRIAQVDPRGDAGYADQVLLDVQPIASLPGGRDLALARAAARNRALRIAL